MCLIIASDRGILPDRSLVKDAFDDNGDGFGVVWAKDGRLHTYKTLRVKKALAFLPTLEGHPYVMHFRFATHGRVDIENVHPFKVTRHLYMAHNGIIEWAAIKGSARSDSWHFAGLVGQILGNDKRAEGFDDELPEIEKAVGLGNKLAFLRSDGELFIANEKAGTYHGGLWLSNRYSLPQYRTVAKWYDLTDWTPKGTAAATDWPEWDDGAYAYADAPTWDKGDECDGCNTWYEDGLPRYTVDGVTVRLCRACKAEFFGQGV